MQAVAESPSRGCAGANHSQFAAAQLQHRLFELMARYTFSKTIDDASQDTEQPQNPHDPAAERALSLDDQRHRWTIRRTSRRLGIQTRSSGSSMGWNLPRLWRWTAAFRDNPLTGADSNEEHIDPLEARPLGVEPNAMQTPPLTFVFPYDMDTAVSLERQLSRNTTASITDVNSRGVHQFLANDINAPLPGTFNPGDPTSGSPLIVPERTAAPGAFSIRKGSPVR